MERRDRSTSSCLRAHERIRYLSRFTVLSVVIALTGCWSSGTSLVRTRSAVELDCPEADIEVEMISGLAENGRGATFIARGCGKRATYIRADAAAVVLDSPIQVDEGP